MCRMSRMMRIDVFLVLTAGALFVKGQDFTKQDQITFPNHEYTQQRYDNGAPSAYPPLAVPTPYTAATGTPINALPATSSAVQPSIQTSANNHQNLNLAFQNINNNQISSQAPQQQAPPTLQQSLGPQQLGPQQQQQQLRPQQSGGGSFATVSSRDPNAPDNFEYVRDFSWELFSAARTPSAIANLILSPIQVQMILSLLRTAAVDVTESEIRGTLRETNPRLINDLVVAIRQSSSEYTVLEIASAIFAAIDLRLNSTFLQESRSRNVEITSVNFANIDEASYTINNWISRATHGRIQQLYKPEAVRSARLLLATTMHFNGEWKFAFNQTFAGRFETTPRLSKTVTMMKGVLTIRAGDLVARNGYSGRWIELPYAKNDFSMIVIVPNQRHYLDELIRSLDSVEITKILKQLDSSWKKKVFLDMPKFEVGSTFSFVNTLLKLGIVDLFTQNCRLPYLAENENSRLRVDDIIQQSILSVDERGTVASVATISHVVTLSLNTVHEEISFIVDQPFISIIVDKRNKVPLFISKIYDP